jgi:hypothetical protein
MNKPVKDTSELFETNQLPAESCFSRISDVKIAVARS